jgi:hypothetical protein
MKISIRGCITAIWFAALLLAVALLSFIPRNVNAEGKGNLLRNGTFEQGFVQQAGCGTVGVGWHCFTNDGETNYGFFDDTDPAIAADGLHSQRIELSTVDQGFANHDRFAGLYQTVSVDCLAVYQISLRGMVRTSTKDDSFRDPWRYRIQIGWVFGSAPTWQAVTNWSDVGWDTYGYQLATTPVNSYQAKLIAQDPYITIFVRVWKKWGEIGEKLEVNLDSISLTPSSNAGPILPTLGPTPIPTVPALKLIGGTPVADLPTPPITAGNFRYTIGVDPITGWPRLFGDHVAFSYPSSWQPTRTVISPTATLETYQLGIGYLQAEQSIGFSNIGFQDIPRPDLVIVTKITIGGKEGVKVLRQDPTHVIHEYCTSGLNNQGSFCVRVSLAVDSPMLALQLDRLVESIVFY